MSGWGPIFVRKILSLLYYRELLPRMSGKKWDQSRTKVSFATGWRWIRHPARLLVDSNLQGRLRGSTPQPDKHGAPKSSASETSVSINSGTCRRHWGDKGPAVDRSQMSRPDHLFCTPRPPERAQPSARNECMERWWWLQSWGKHRPCSVCGRSWLLEDIR